MPRLPRYRPTERPDGVLMEPDFLPRHSRPRLVKLVRDNIGAVVGDSHVSYNSIPGEDAAFIRALRRKLVEEAIEYVEDPSISELADVLEVVYALAAIDLEVQRHELEARRADKHNELGGFEHGIGMYVETNASERNG